ncbi:MAG: amidohydrolase [Candidatus Micrarchaeota archaeon]|nr:amidohydrolase [Candidatus Micrarchaeota archaeon]
MSILIKNATVVTQNATREIIDNCDILITNNKIESIGKNLKTENGKPETIIDATGKIAMPGLINSHTHVAMTLLRGLGEDLPLQEWLEKKIWPAEAKLTGKDVYNGTMLGICEMLRSGVTCFNDMYLVGVDEIAKACIETGIRGSLSDAAIATIGHKLDRAIAFAKKWKGKNSLVTPHISCHSIYACPEDMLIKAKESADKEKLKFHMHISETRKEIFDCLEKTKKYPIDYLDNIGLLDENTILAHAGWVTKREIALAGKKKATIVNCPISNLKLATGGICQITEFDQQGANVCLGTDGAASNNSLNMFETMKMSSLLQKHHYWKADVLPTQRILDFATINGAKALGINAGSIEKGKLADIILLDGKAANMLPRNDLISNIVYAAGPQNVTDVIINGKIVMRERVIQTVDEEKIVDSFRQI